MKKPSGYIEEALLRLLKENNMDRISVSMVCEECNVSRQTLYYHYDSLIDVFTGWAGRSILSEIEENDNYKSWADGFLLMLQFYRKYKDEFLNVFRSGYRKELESETWSMGTELIGRAVDEISADYSIPLIPGDRKFMVNFYMDVFSGILKRYFSNDMEDDPEYIVSRCRVMMDLSIEKTERELQKLYTRA